MWLVSEVRNDNKLYWRADSDSELTKARRFSRTLLPQHVKGHSPINTVVIVAALLQRFPPMLCLLISIRACSIAGVRSRLL